MANTPKTPENCPIERTVTINGETFKCSVLERAKRFYDTSPDGVFDEVVSMVLDAALKDTHNG